MSTVESSSATPSATPSTTAHYLLLYDVVDDYVARRAIYRDAHLSHAWQAHERGDLVLAGALADPVDGAVLLFRGPSPDAAVTFANADPYVTSGLVTRWRVRKWSTVVGVDAATPIRPSAVAAQAFPALPDASGDTR